LAVALEHVEPTMDAQKGEVVVRLIEPNEIYERAIETGRADLLAALHDEVAGVRSVRLAKHDAPGSSVPPARLTAESAKAEEVAALRKKDRVLGAAIDALDLELVDER